MNDFTAGLMGRTSPPAELRCIVLLVERAEGWRVDMIDCNGRHIASPYPLPALVMAGFVRALVPELAQ